MIKLPTGNPILHRPWACFVTLLLWLGLCSPAGALDLGIESEADYQYVLDGIRAAEYVRQRYLEGEANPRALVSSAALWAFAERNPLVTPDQLTAFVSRFDARMAVTVPGDPDLLSNGAVLAALSTGRIADTIPLEGTDTRVGARVLELLGMELGGLGGLGQFSNSRQRMTRFDLASVQKLIHRRETADMLIMLLSGRTPGGEPRPMLAEIADAYLAGQGLDPMLGLIDEADLSLANVNQGLADLPSYADYLGLLTSATELNDLKDVILGDIRAIQDEGDQIVIPLAVPMLDQFSSSLAVTMAASDPDAADHDAAIEELNRIRDSINQRSRDTAARRASVFARTLLLQQADFEEIQAAAFTARSYAALQLQTNNSLAIMQETAGIAGSLVGVGVGIIKEDPWETFQSLTNVVTGALGLGALLGEQAPSAEEQIFDQIIELRDQVQAMQVQLNDRFDVVDQKLNAVFSTMSDGFMALGEDINNLQIDVDALSITIAQARSSLERIEDALFGFFAALAQTDFLIRSNEVLNYYANNGVSLPYDRSNPNFIVASSYFYTFATSISKDYAGTPDNQALTLTVDNAAELLDSDVVARYLNDLRRVPAGLGVAGPLIGGRVAAPAFWAQAAAAYIQLAQENPWYFNFQLASQMGSGGSIRIDEIIQEGDRIIALADAVRGHRQLFDALLDRARQQADNVQAAIDSAIDGVRTPPLSNGIQRVDPWAGLDQIVTPLLAPIGTIRWFSAEVGTPVLGSWSINTFNFPHRGHEIAVADRHIIQPPVPPSTSRAEKAERNALTYLLANGRIRPEVDMYMINRRLNGTHNKPIMWLCSDRRSIYGTCRRIDFQKEYFRDGQWRPVVSAPTTLPDWTYGDSISRAWPSISNALASGNLEGQTYSTGSLFFPFPFSYQTRLRVTQDYSCSSCAFMEWLGVPEDEWWLQVNFLTTELAALRDEARQAVLDQFTTPGSVLEQAAQGLDNTAALLDAYLSLGMGDALTQSEILRSALRGAPGIAGMGFRSDDLLRLIEFDLINDDGSAGGNSGLALTALNTRLKERIEGLAIEIDQALGTSAPSFPYVEMILEDLRALRSEARQMAIGDTFELGNSGDGVLVVAAADGLVRNDELQDGTVGDRVVVDLDFFNSPEAVLPTKGQLSIAEDGSFSYVADPGASGIDRFSYRLRAPIEQGSGATADAFSEPTVVILRVGDPVSTDRIFRDGFE
ncbi:MAG: Ig-like domain-containing protein [Wenzhouxiangella sp.]|jgi:hypothetical protein|nr:Ig-like domain-containing protein [Wenzhouxiangella sp.]